MTKRETFQISLSPQTSSVVRRLRATGLFGLTDDEVIERIVDERVRALILDGWAPMPKPR
jgi:hypothetical protein